MKNHKLLHPLNNGTDSILIRIRQYKRGVLPSDWSSERFVETQMLAGNKGWAEWPNLRLLGKL